MENAVPDEILNAPGKVAALVDAMIAGGDPEMAITPEEGEELTTPPDNGGNGSTSKQSSNSRTWTPRGEGQSGEIRVPTIDVQSKSVIQMDESEGEEAVSCADPHENDSEPPAEPLGSVSEVPISQVTPYATIADIDDVVAGVDEMITHKLAETTSETNTELAKLRQTTQTMQRAINSLVVRLNTVEVRLQTPLTVSRIRGLPVTPQGETSTTPVPATRVAKPPGPVTRPTSAGSTASVDRQQIVAKFLSENPDYPSIALVRGAKIRRLAMSLGFLPGSTDVPPSGWSVDGILEFLSRPTEPTT